jgi:hypothetical protein
MLHDSQDDSFAKRLAKENADNGEMPALWLQVLLNLASVTTDRRAELRNTAVQTIQRIFDNYADELSLATWLICLHAVPLSAVRTNLAIHQSIRKEKRAAPEEVGLWNETTRILLDSVAALFATFMDNNANLTEFGAVWTKLLGYLQDYFQCRSHALARSVFTTISTVLSRTDSVRLLDSASLAKTAVVWKDYADQGRATAWDGWSQDNQEAYVAYVEAFKAIYRLSQRDLDSRLPSMLSNLRYCVAESDDVPYSPDVDNMTPFQTQVIESLSMINLGSVEVQEALISTLSELVTLPYSDRIKREKGNPTFVAISKAAMDLLPSITIRHIMEQGIHSSTAFSSAMQSLCKTIEEKYVWQQEGKNPTLWQKATTATLAILSTGIEKIKCTKEEKEQTRRLWADTLQRVVARVIGVRWGLADAMPFVENDEQFDMNGFSTLRKMAAEALGWECVPNTLRLNYARDLFQTSIIHPQIYEEAKNRQLVEAPLQDLYRIRFGQTKDPEPVPRTEMAYMCFDELVALVAAHKHSPDRVRLAKAAAPYLTLRAALPLKAYIADQPLRGRMPAPDSQRRELLYTLDALKQLRSEPQAIPDAPGVRSTYRKHLHRLYPLLIQATTVARQDTEVFSNVVDLTAMIGDEFGLDGPVDDDDDDDDEDEDEDVAEQ